MRKESGGDWKTIKTVSSSNNSYTDKTTKNGVKYYYAVKAVKGDSLSYYESKSFKYFGSPKATVANKTSAITVTWDKISGAKSYYVYRKAPGETSWKRIAIVTKNIYTDSNVKNGKIYKYTVKAYYSAYVSAYNTNGYAVRRLLTPTLKSVTSAKSGITFTWNKVTGATGYMVYRKTGNGGWQKIATVKGTSKISYLDKSAKKGVTYKYTVKAYYGTSTSYYNTKGLTIKDKY